MTESETYEACAKFCERFCPSEGTGRGLSQFYAREFRARAQQAREPVRQVVRKTQKEAA